MIDWIEGLLAAKELDRVVLEVGGVGFRIAIPLSTYEALPDAGTRARLLTHLHVREDELSLYGFATADEKRAFETATGVSGIGPKLALLLLSTFSVRRLAEAVTTGDVATLVRVPGVGRKTAERLVVELRDKFEDLALEAGVPSGRRSTATVPGGERGAGAIKALVTLGFPRAQASDAVGSAVEEAPDAELEELVRRALGVLGGQPAAKR